MRITRWLPILLLGIGCFLFFYFQLYHYFNLEDLRQHEKVLMTWTQENYFLAVIFFILIYGGTVAMAIPSAAFLDIAAGYLFGLWLGIIYVLISATIGGIILFLAVKISFTEWVHKNMSHKIKKMEKGFQENAFNYIFTLRLIPIFPFWLVNVVAALFDVSLKRFTLATLIGIIPGTFIYAALGNNLQSFVMSEQDLNLDIIFRPQFLFPLLGLSLLVMMPILYKYYRNRKITSRQSS